jgi:hypothetical protein
MTLMTLIALKVSIILVEINKHMFLMDDCKKKINPRKKKTRIT